MKKNLLSAILLIVVLTGCKKEKKPTATFTLAKSNYYLTEPVLISNSATNATSYAWDFGDGSTSTEQNPQHAYSKKGNFQIKLTVNGSSTATKNVKVYAGTASYEVQNNTTTPVPLVSFAITADNELIDFQEHGTMQAGAKSDTVFTTNDNIGLGGQLYGKTFIVIDQYPMVNFKHSVVALTNQSQIYIDNSVKDKNIQNLFRTKINRQIFKNIQ